MATEHRKNEENVKNISIRGKSTCTKNQLINQLKIKRLSGLLFYVILSKQYRKKAMLKNYDVSLLGNQQETGYKAEISTLYLKGIK